MLSEELQKEIYFPYPKIREVQADMISDVHNAIKEKKHIIMHAPTGIGKTVSVLAPALPFAISNNLTIFFLTSRQTLHRIVVDTLRHIKQKFGIEIEAVDIIGKKWMCLQQGVEAMQGSSFHEYCKNLREEGKCEFYTRTLKDTGAPTFEAKHAVEELKANSPYHVQEYIEKGSRMKLCPYELAMLSSYKAKAVIADYSYMFNASIRNGFLMKMKRELKDCIVIVDEAHNLPNRLREMLTSKTSSQAIEIARKEALRHGFDISNLEFVENALFMLGKDINNEDTVSKSSFVGMVEQYKKYDDIAAELIFTGESIRDKQKLSYVLSLGKFLEAWLGPDAGFGRILSKKIEKGRLKIALSYRCLDPSIAAREVIEGSYSTVLMSGTLTPTSMYRDLLGFNSAIEKEYKNPFPKKNRLDLIVPKTTTKFVERSARQYSEIASVCGDIANLVQGNSAIFFPSYDLMSSIMHHLMEKVQKPLFMEKQHMSKKEKEQLLAAFKGHKGNGAVLLGTSTGSFGEGIDMPGVLKAVIIAGLPLNKPDVEARLLIEYYDDKFGKGFEYGYVLPSITKCLQNAGRCIRSETDKGAIIFLDERYASQSYYKCFPEDWEIEVDLDYMGVLKEFFNRK